MRDFIELTIYDYESQCINDDDGYKAFLNINSIICATSEYDNCTRLNIQGYNHVIYVRHSYGDFKKIITHGNSALYKAING